MLLEQIKKNGKLWIIILMAAAGVIFLFLGNSDVFYAATNTDEDCVHEEKLLIEDYERALEEDIAKFCEALGNTKSVSVSVRLSGSSQSIYAENSQNGTGSDRDEYVIIGSGSNAHPIYIGEKSPEILGVGVIIYMNGATLTKTQAEELIATAYGVPLNRIYVKIIESR